MRQQGFTYQTLLIVGVVALDESLVAYHLGAVRPAFRRRLSLAILLDGLGAVDSINTAYGLKGRSECPPQVRSSLLSPLIGEDLDFLLH